MIQFSETDFKEFYRAYNHDVRGALGRIHQLVSMIDTEDIGMVKKTYPYLKASAIEGYQKIKRMGLMMKIIQHDTHFTDIAVHDLIHVLWEKQTESYPEAKLHMPEQFVCRSDVFIVEHVINEIIENACVHYQGENDLELTVSFDDLTSTIHFIDNGRGFDPSLTDQVMKPFKKLSPQTLDDPHVGMGLYICNCSMKKLGGAFRITPESSGCRVSVSFKSVLSES